MKRVNILSTTGLLLAFNFAIERAVHAVPGPSGLPFVVSSSLLAVFAISYLASLLEVKNSFLKLSIISMLFLAMVVTGIYSVMVLMHKVYFPSFMRINLSYIYFVLLLLLTYFWNSKKQ